MFERFGTPLLPPPGSGTWDMIRMFELPCWPGGCWLEAGDVPSTRKPITAAASLRFIPPPMVGSVEKRETGNVRRYPYGANVSRFHFPAVNWSCPALRLPARYPTLAPH